MGICSMYFIEANYSIKTDPTYFQGKFYSLFVSH